jgi:YhcH/YjgK/YiaL family protein
MIVDSLKHAEKYLAISPRLSAALKFLQTADVATLPTGKHVIDGDDVYALVMDYQSKPISEGFLEAHRKYIDVQYVASGVERIGYVDLAKTVPGEYDEAKDFLKAEGTASMVVIDAGTFAVFFPHDAHMPCIAVDQPTAVRKVVVKVRA